MIFFPYISNKPRSQRESCLFSTSGGEETVQHFVIECGELREIWERYGVCGAEALEEVLLFGGRSGEKVEQCKKMLEEMWKLRRRRIEPVQ